MNRNYLKMKQEVPEDYPSSCARCDKIIQHEEHLTSFELSYQQLFWIGDNVSYTPKYVRSLLEFCDECKSALKPETLSLKIEDADGRVFSVDNFDSLP